MSKAEDKAALDKAASRIVGWLSFLALLSVLFLIGIEQYKAVIFDRECGGHLKRAADANTIRMAADELNIAVHYLENNNLTYGYTSVLYSTPDEDVEFWYKNLKSSLEQLQTELAKTPESSPLEQSNLLLKLRQTLLDHNQHGESVTHPAGICLYPHNALYAGLDVVCYPLGVIALFVLWVVIFDPKK